MLQSINLSQWYWLYIISGKDFTVWIKAQHVYGVIFELDLLIILSK